MIKKILIVDDHDLIRDGIIALLKSEEDFLVVGQTGSGRQALELACALQPDLLLLDLSMPDMDGMDVLHHLVELKAPVKVLILTVHEDDTLLREALRAGASGYIIKRAAGTELVKAIRDVLSGHLYIHPDMARSILLRGIDGLSAVEDGEADLTEREIEVLRLIVRGFTNREISRILTITVRTVEKHRANIMQKIGVHARVDLLDYARERRLI